MPFKEIFNIYAYFNLIAYYSKGFQNEQFSSVIISETDHLSKLYSSTTTSSKEKSDSCEKDLSPRPDGTTMLRYVLSVPTLPVLSAQKATTKRALCRSSTGEIFTCHTLTWTSLLCSWHDTSLDSSLENRPSSSQTEEMTNSVTVAANHFQSLLGSY